MSDPRAMTSASTPSEVIRRPARRASCSSSSRVARPAFTFAQGTSTSPPGTCRALSSSRAFLFRSPECRATTQVSAGRSSTPAPRAAITVLGGVGQPGDDHHRGPPEQRRRQRGEQVALRTGGLGVDIAALDLGIDRAGGGEHAGDRPAQQERLRAGEQRQRGGRRWAPGRVPRAGSSASASHVGATTPLRPGRHRRGDQGEATGRTGSTARSPCWSVRPMRAPASRYWRRVDSLG